MSAETTKHAATVHLTLVATSLALLIATRLNESSSAGRAREQLRDVKLIAAKLGPGWRANYFGYYQPSEAYGTSAPTVTLVWRPNEAIGPAWAMDPTNLTKDRYEWSIAWKSAITDVPPSERDPISKLQDPHFHLSVFRDVWELLRQFDGVYHITRLVAITVYPSTMAIPSCDDARGLAGVVTEFRKSAGLPVHPVDAEAPVRSVEIQPPCTSSSARERVRFYIWAHAYYPTATGLTYCLAKLDVEATAVPLQSPLAGILRSSGLRETPRPFDDAFADLRSLTERFDDIPVDQIDRILSTFEEQGGGGLEILGVKTPPDALTVWGCAVLIGIQLYLLITIQQIVSRISHSSERLDAVWMALYRGRLPKIATLLTAVVLPAVSVCIVAYHGALRSDTRYAVAFIIATMSIIASSFVWRSLARLWRAG